MGGTREANGATRAESADGRGAYAPAPAADGDGADTPLLDAPDAGGMTAQQIVCLVGYCLAFVVFGSQVSVLGPTIKPLSERLSVDETDLSPLFTALGVSCILSGTPSGWFVDRYPTHAVLIVSLAVEAVGFALVPLMPDVWSLTALYFVICFSYNFTNSAVFSGLVWLFPGRAGGALNMVLAMFGVGSFLIPLVAQLCAIYGGSALQVFWCIAATSCLAMVPLIFTPSPKKPDARGAGDDEVLVKEDKTYQAITTVAVVTLVFLSTAAETAVGNWLFTYCSKEMHLEDEIAAFANSMFWAAFTIGRVVGVVLSRFLTPGQLLLSATPFSVVGASLPLLFAGSMTRPLIFATALLTGFGNSTGYANAVALLERYVPVTGFINGIFGAVAGAACMIGPTAVAMLIKHTSLGYQSMAWVGLTFYALHFPAILTAVTAGEKAAASAIEAAAAAGLLDYEPEAADGSRVAGDVSGAAAIAIRDASRAGSLHEPLFSTSHASRLSLGEPLLLTPGHFPQQHDFSAGRYTGSNDGAPGMLGSSPHIGMLRRHLDRSYHRGSAHGAPHGGAGRGIPAPSVAHLRESMPGPNTASAPTGARLLQGYTPPSASPEQSSGSGTLRGSRG
uniref:Major facilitator superfamily (MFS) profile domain-containing protein n=1 Tax=Chlamydomonas euryale TaxID=1486919 RepID=A0A7R9YX00_9CHLO|mmetsp:Transcript_30597/g.90704  ORF Transcript_30597/g.90704 Transcript_30597/m.90704 type:complete len:619 (+) Transcript_30597:161-2017(+)